VERERAAGAARLRAAQEHWEAQSQGQHMRLLAETDIKVGVRWRWRRELAPARRV
jgi:hypothetical protein